MTERKITRLNNTYNIFFSFHFLYSSNFSTSPCCNPWIFNNMVDRQTRFGHLEFYRKKLSIYWRNFNCPLYQMHWSYQIIYFTLRAEVMGRLTMYFANPGCNLSNVVLFGFVFAATLWFNFGLFHPSLLHSVLLLFFTTTY